MFVDHHHGCVGTGKIKRKGKGKVVYERMDASSNTLTPRIAVDAEGEHGTAEANRAKTGKKIFSVVLARVVPSNTDNPARASSGGIVMVLSVLRVLIQNP